MNLKDWYNNLILTLNFTQTHMISIAEDFQIMYADKQLCLLFSFVNYRVVLIFQGNTNNQIHKSRYYINKKSDLLCTIVCFTNVLKMWKLSKIRTIFFPA